MGFYCLVWILGSEHGIFLPGMDFWDQSIGFFPAWRGFRGQSMGFSCLVWILGSEHGYFFRLELIFGSKSQSADFIFRPPFLIKMVLFLYFN
jgi:hypothetical protein